MNTSAIGPNPLPQPVQKPTTHYEIATIPPTHSVQMAYDSSIDRYVSQVVKEGEVVRQIPSTEAVSFIRSFRTAVLALFGKEL